MSAQFKDYYAILGVPHDAGADEIKKAFRKLARQYHPDTASDKKAAEERFKEINEANEVLSDPGKRKKYDTLGARWQDAGDIPAAPGGEGSDRSPGGPAQEFHFGGTGFSDFFEQYFSGGSRYGFPGALPEDDAHGQTTHGRGRRGHDIEGDILITLDEAIHGTQRPVSLQTVDRPGGKVQTHTFEVRIPAGASDGRRIRVSGEGEPGRNGGAAGDLYLRVRHAAHPDFTARESDIHYDLEIAPWDAVLGAEVIVPTLDGSIKLRVPSGTGNGQSLRVRGRGLPKGGAGERGAFIVTIHIAVPASVSAEERLLWEQLRTASSFNPRP